MSYLTIDPQFESCNLKENEENMEYETQEIEHEQDEMGENPFPEEMAESKERGEPGHNSGKFNFP